MTPDSVTNTYLSSSKDKNFSSISAVTFPVEFDVIVTSNCFLIVKTELVKSTSLIFCFGSLVYKLLSTEITDLVPSNLKSYTEMLVFGSPPSQTPVTVVMPDMVKVVAVTEFTLEYVGYNFPCSV